MSLRSPKRVLLVVFGLAATGAALGAVCGLVATLPWLIQGLSRSGEHVRWGNLLWFWGQAAGLGAEIGAIGGPILAFSFLRHVPLSRVFTHAVLGTAAGSVVGWMVARNPWFPGFSSIIMGSVIGLVGGCIVARLRVPRAVPSEVG